MSYVSIALRFSFQNDNIAMISSIYHDAILTHTGLELTAEEIDSALQLILQERQQAQTTTTQGLQKTQYKVFP